MLYMGLVDYKQCYYDTATHSFCIYDQEKMEKEKQEKLDMFLQWLPGIGVVLSAIIEHRIQGLSEYRITGTAYAAWLMASIAAGITIAMALIYVCRKGIKKNAAMATPVPNEEGRSVAKKIKSDNRIFTAGILLMTVGMVVIPITIFQKTNTFLLCAYWLFPFTVITLLALFNPLTRARAIRQYKKYSEELRHDN